AMSARVAAFGARMEAALAFIPTELLALPDGTVERYLAEQPDLVPYRKQLDDVLLARPHTLSADAERALTALGESLDAPLTVYKRTITADLVCTPIDDGRAGTLPMS